MNIINPELSIDTSASEVNEVSEVKKGRGIERIIPTCFFLLVFVLPVFFIPNISYPAQFSKALLLSVLVLLSFALWLLARLKDGRFVIPSSRILIALAAVVGSFVLSGLFSGSMALSLFGQGFEIGTAFNVAILSILTFLVPTIFRARGQIFGSYLAFLAAFFVIALFHLLRIFFGPDFLAMGLFTDTISNTIGKWNDLGVFFGVATLLSLTTIEFLSPSRLLKVFIYLALVLSLFFLAVVNFSMIWWVLGLFSLIFLVYLISFRPVATPPSEGSAGISPSPRGTRALKRLSIPALLILIVSAVFIFGGSALGTKIGTALGISQIEVRPSWGATLHVARETLSESPLLGSGPNQFTLEWLKYKPEGINSTIFWNADFDFGVGLVPTFFVTTGLLGTLAWLAFLLTFLYYGFRAVLTKFSDRLSQYLVTSSFFVSLFLWIFSVFYIPSLSIFFLTFFFTGLFIASLTILGIAPTKTISFIGNPRAGFVSVLLLILLLIGSIGLGYAVVQKYVSYVLFQKGVITFNREGDLDKSEKLITRAAAMSPTDIYFRFLTEESLLRLNTVLNKRADPATAEATRADFQKFLGDALFNARQAVDLNPKNYQNPLTLGRVYESVVPLKIEGAYESAHGAYVQALALNPISPAVHLAMARLEVAKGDSMKARESIALALKEKNNYTEAIFFLSQIEAAEGNIKAAISSAEAASTIAPDDSTVFFQLGILRFNDRNYAGAATALERAVALNPVYANAKYFLGLSYERLKRTPEAITQFTDLKATNPDNKEIDLILANLKAGRDPFSDAAPPVDATPEKRPKLPVAEKEVDAGFSTDEE